MTEVRSPAPQDHLAAILIGRDGVAQVWEGGKRTATVSADTARLVKAAIEAVARA